MFENLEPVRLRYEELLSRLADPSVLADSARWAQLSREAASLEPVVKKYEEYRKTLNDIDDAKALLENESDEEMLRLAKEELSEAQEKEQTLAKELRVLLLPEDPNDGKNIFMEIRAGAGGEEAALFAAEIYRMYARYAERKGWSIELVSSSETELGGLKEAVLMIRGSNVYSRLKFESGVHRVQRVPLTEANGKLQTSTVTVAVLPEAEDVDVEINPGDLRIDIFRSSGAGGQKVNKTSTAIRITHLPTGIVVTCQNERSQLQNKEQAMRVLRARLLEREQRKQQQAVTSSRRLQVGTGERSEKIRTYNFPQNRVTDHRIKYSSHRIGEILDGDLDEIIDRLLEEDQSERLAASSEE